MSEVKLQEKTTNQKLFIGNVSPAVIAVWAALIAVAHMLPSIPVIGTGGTFSVSAALIPLAGIFFGPVGGAICVAIGNFIGQIIAPHIAWLGLGTFLVGAVNAYASGLVSRGKWLYAVGIIIVGGILYYSTAIGREAMIFPVVFYGLGIIVATLTGLFAYKWLEKDNPLLKGIAIWGCAFAGFVGSAALANYFGILLLHIPSDVWKFLTFVAPVERTTFALGAALIGVPLLIGLPKIGVFVGPQKPEEDDGEE